MTTTPTRLMTAEELFARADDGRFYELVEGVLHEVSPASPRSSKIGMRLGARLLNFVESRRLGEVFGAEAGFVLARGPDTVRAPDVAFVRADRLPPDEDQDYFLSLAPDLAAEVVSPSDRLSDVRRKVQQYLATGVRLVWVIDPRRERATVYAPSREPCVLGLADVLEGEDVLPGFSVALADLLG